MYIKYMLGLHSIVLCLCVFVCLPKERKSEMTQLNETSNKNETSQLNETSNK